MNKNDINWDEVDKPRSNCGVVGIYGSDEAARLVYLSLYSLQHRGQESAGISSFDGKKFYHHAGMGLVADVFNDDETFTKLRGSMAIGHNRYSTTGPTRIINAQPLLAKSKYGMISISHNGNLVNARRVRKNLENEGAIFQTTSDTEVILHLLARTQADNMVDRLREVFTILKGAYSLTILTEDAVYGLRDPKGFRPLCIGKKDKTLILASETCAIDLLGGTYVREVEAGEIVVLDKKGISSHILGAPQERTACIFEHVYFSRPDSKVFDENVDRARRKLGKNLALEKPCEADIVISVPDSSNTAAVGYSRRSEIKFELGLIRNHYIGRTFIQPGQEMRDFKVRVKFNVVKGVIDGRRVVVVEDSIVRGTTLRQLTRMLKNAGAKEVHIRVTSPPITSPCYYGMDFPTREELIANEMSTEKICEYLGADSLEYLSTEGLLNSVPHDKGGYCTACFTGDYPIPPEKIKNKNDLED
ncbi:MAG: amidophosphoribosyltransferase [Calditrichaeota bacterium]|nr:MAG: amidophosphoribosyltransferase [Calditrichota bacterium]